MTTPMAMDLDTGNTPTPTGRIVIQKVAGRSAVTSIFARYPLKFIRPTKAVSSEVDAVWIYTVSFGGGFVSGDSVTCTMTIGDGCTAVLTTQASTKVYKSVGSKGSEQSFETLLEQGAGLSVSDRMQAFHVVAMLVILGPKMTNIQNEVKEKIRERNTELFGRRSHSSNPNYKKAKPCIENKASNSVLLASCSVFGPMDTGLVVRIIATSTESVYKFLREHLAPIEPFIGTSPYSGR